VKEAYRWYSSDFDLSPLSLTDLMIIGIVLLLTAFSVARHIPYDSISNPIVFRE